MRPALAATAVIVGCLLAAGCVGVLPSDSAPTTYNGTVTGIVDGDTLDVRLADGTTERVRLLGIDTPEVHVRNEPEHFEGVPNTTDGRACLRSVGQNASAFVADRLRAEPVRLEIDVTADRRGGYGRLLAYVFHEEGNVNYLLVERGYAAVYPTTFELRDRFEAAARTARAADRGVWGCRDP